MTTASVLRVLPVDVDRVRETTRRIVAEETASVIEQHHGHGSRLVRRSLVLAFVTGYLGSFVDQIARDHTDPDEIAAVLAGVLDVVDTHTGAQPARRTA